MADAGATAAKKAATTARASGRITSRLVAVDHAIDEAVLRGLAGLEEAVALHVAVDLLLALARVLGVDLVDALARLEDLVGVDLDVGRLALEARRRLVDEDPRVRQRHPLAVRAAGQQ